MKNITLYLFLLLFIGCSHSKESKDLVIEITDSIVMYNGEKIFSIKELDKAKIYTDYYRHFSNDTTIKKLKNVLEMVYKGREDSLQRIIDSTSGSFRSKLIQEQYKLSKNHNSKLIIKAKYNTKFNILYKIISTCTLQGFNHLSFIYSDDTYKPNNEKYDTQHLSFYIKDNYSSGSDSRNKLDKLPEKDFILNIHHSNKMCYQFISCFPRLLFFYDKKIETEESSNDYLYESIRLHPYSLIENSKKNMADTIPWRSIRNIQTTQLKPSYHFNSFDTFEKALFYHYNGELVLDKQMNLFSQVLSHLGSPSYEDKTAKDLVIGDTLILLNSFLKYRKGDPTVNYEVIVENKSLFHLSEISMYERMIITILKAKLTINYVSSLDKATLSMAYDDNYETFINMLQLLKTCDITTIKVFPFSYQDYTIKQFKKPYSLDLNLEIELEKYVHLK